MLYLSSWYTFHFFFSLSLIVLYSLFPSCLSYRLLFPSTIWHNKDNKGTAISERDAWRNMAVSICYIFLSPPIPRNPQCHLYPCGVRENPCQCQRRHKPRLDPRHRRHRERREAILTEILHEKLRWLGWHMRWVASWSFFVLVCVYGGYYSPLHLPPLASSLSDLTLISERVLAGAWRGREGSKENKWTGNDCSSDCHLPLLKMHSIIY